MPEYTANHSIAYPLPGDRIKDPNVAAKLAEDIRVTAFTVDTAVTSEGARAEHSAKQYADTEISDLEDRMKPKLTLISPGMYELAAPYLTNTSPGFYEIGA